MKAGAILAAIPVLAAALWFIGQWSGGPAAGPAKGPEDDALVAVALPERLNALEKSGKRAFDAKCAVCHGENAQGRDGVGPPLVHQIYEPGHHGDMAFVLAAQNGVRAHHWPFGSMPAVEGITRAEVMSIISYIRALQRENGIN